MHRNRLVPLKNGGVSVVAEDFIVFEIASRSVPSGVDHIFIVQLFEHSVAAQNYKIVVTLYLKTLNVGCWHHASRIPTVARILSLDIADRSRNRESPRKNSMRTYDSLHA